VSTFILPDAEKSALSFFDLQAQKTRNSRSGFWYGVRDVSAQEPPQAAVGLDTRLRA